VSEPSSRYRPPSLRDLGAWARLAAIGAVVAVLVGAFAYTGGWFSPHRLTQARVIDAFEAVNGPHPGFRRNHAKGVCAAGQFHSNGQGASLSTAAVFRPGVVPVIGRFAFAGGQPAMDDSPAAVRSLALSFRPAGGEEWRTGMLDIPVFPVSTPRAFYAQLLTGKPDSATGKPDPAATKAFLARHPETVAATKLIKAQPFSSGFANADYNGLNAFRFIAASGASVPVRWSIVAVDPFAPEDPAAAAAGDKTYLFDALAARIRQGPAQWRLVVTVGKPGDPTNDATRPWPADRRKIEVGVVSIDRLESEGRGGCRDINFDPLVLPAGMAPSDDPLLSARSAAYSTSFTRRAGEAKTPSAVQVPAVEARP
jgi:catalase